MLMGQVTSSTALTAPSSGHPSPVACGNKPFTTLLISTKTSPSSAILFSQLTILCRRIIPYQACGDHLFKPFGLRLVIKVNTAHQIISCNREENKDNSHKTITLTTRSCRHFPLGAAVAQYYFQLALLINPRQQTCGMDFIIRNDKQKDLIYPFINFRS